MRTSSTLAAIVSTSALLLSAVAPVRAGTTKQGCDGAGKEAAVHGSEHKELAAQTTCPVMGGAINREWYADYQGKRVYFCWARLSGWDSGRSFSSCPGPVPGPRGFGRRARLPGAGQGIHAAS